MGDDPKLTPGSEGDITSLIDAFRYFNEAATTLGAAYRKLESRIQELTEQLEEKDSQLYSRLIELDRVTKYLTSLVESLSSGVVAVDMNGMITIFNRSAAGMLGIAAESAIGCHYTDILGNDAGESGALRTLREGPELRGVERVLYGRGIKVAYQTTWVVDSLGDRIGVVEVFEDVSLMRDLEARLEHQKTLSALGEMAAAVAHELRNPLAGIGGFAALLKKDLAGDPKLASKVDRILQGVHALDRVAGNLLFLTRQTTIKREEIDLQSLLSEIVQLLESEIHGSGSDIGIHLSLPAEQIPVSADRELMRLVFTNVTKNAVQAIPSGRKGEVAVELLWKLLANRFEVLISDNGIGIPDENRERLFSPFFTTRHSGTGLGLALVKKVIDLHKGEIHIDSAEGVGTRFSISLPIRPLAAGESYGQLVAAKETL
ncbi:MAG: PAS domain S-box protein [Calditrichaeota bacterium]|nr:PAS domain S-box protein [Calditrichota bacterium]